MNFNVFLATLGFKPNDQLDVHADFSYTMSQGSIDPINWAGIDPKAITVLVETGKWDYDFSGVDGLSDLDVTNWNVGIGADFQVNEKWGIYSNFTYAKWEDEEYVLEDNTGDYYMGSLGMVLSF